jgi:protein-tyrosine-phosphatase
MSQQDLEYYGERRIHRAVDDLAEEFHGIWSRETIDRFVRECQDQLQEQGRGAVVNFAGLHAGRFARQRLWALAQAEGRVEKTKPEVLVTDEVVRAADVVVTMGCGDACPVYPGKRYEDWEVADPEAQSIETVRAIRDDIARRAQVLVDSLVAAGAGA